jgi:hypothetical protein
VVRDNKAALIAPIIFGWFFPGACLVVVLIGIGIGITILVDLFKHKQTTLVTAFLFTVIWVAVGTLHDLTIHDHASARCADGHLSNSANRQGTCSYHGGVAAWNVRIPAWWEIISLPFQKAAPPVIPIVQTPPSTNREQIKELIATVFTKDERAFCEYVQGADCHTAFLRTIQFRPIDLSPKGQSGMVVEMAAPGFCGSGGRGIAVLRRTSSGYEKVLDELGSLDDFRATDSLNYGYYDLIRNGKSTVSRYHWTGTRYVVQSTQEKGD